MAKINKNMLNEHKEADKKACYIKKEYTTKEEDCYPLSEWVAVNPILQYVDMNKPAKIIAKKRKDSNFFFKMEIYLEGGTPVEYELSFKHGFDEDELIDPSTLMFCYERFLSDKHLYVTGDTI